MKTREVCEPEIAWTAPEPVRALIQSLGRTEDVRFSPTNRRLAIAGFLGHRIVVCEVEIAADRRITLPSAVAITSPALKLPHGVDFIDDDTIAVANRGYGLSLFRIPAGSAEARTIAVDAIQSLPMSDTGVLRVPGSLSVVDHGNAAEILVCNNAGSDITRHRVAGDAARGLQTGEILLRKFLDVPDGVGVSRDRCWLAISDHGSHSVQLYPYPPSQIPDAEPNGMLRGVYYPHGVRFSADGRHLLVADAGAPFVAVFGQNGGGWSGVRHPLARVRVMDDALFAQGNVNDAEGGPKGIDIDAGGRVLAVAAVHRSLAFFDLQTIMTRVNTALAGRTPCDADADDIGYELHVLQSRRDAAIYYREKSTLLTYMVNSASWRITKPLRRLHELFKGSKQRS